MEQGCACSALAALQHPSLDAWPAHRLHSCTHIREQLFARCLSFLCNVVSMSNSTVLAIANAARADARTDLGSNLAFSRPVYGIEVTAELDVKATRNIIMSSCTLPEADRGHMSVCTELLSALHNETENGLSLDENNHLLHLLCTL